LSVPTEDRLADLPSISSLPTAGSGSSRRSRLDTLDTVVTGALVGGAAIILGWLLTEATGTASANSLGGVAVYVAMLGAVYAAITAAWSDAAAQVWGRALERAATGAWVGLAAGAVSGAIAYELYDHLQQLTADPSGLRFYLLRVLAWAIFGAGIGMAPGIAERATGKVGNGILGGVIGGAVGGAVLHWSSFEVAEAGDARLLGLTAIGVSIGVATAAVELVRRQAWVRIVAGGMSGKEFILYHQSTDIGSSPKAHITLIKDPTAAPIHARIVAEGAGRRLIAVEAPVVVNGTSGSGARLRDGDVIEVGSTTLQYAEVAVGD
jgi:hypothetical protein